MQAAAAALVAAGEAEEKTMGRYQLWHNQLLMRSHQ
jgi:hypothetical protein